VPNATLASDNEIARVGFMTPDEQGGPMKPCVWLKWGHISIRGNRITACKLTGSVSNTLITPDGWSFEGSLSQTFGFVPVGQGDKSLEFLQR
jgi:hypothetical protein